MKINALILLMFGCVIGAASCKKEKPRSTTNPGAPATPKPPPTDTIFPGSYLPAYPGSWWVMHEESGGAEIDTIRTMDTWQIVDNYNYYAYVPVYDHMALYEYYSVPWNGSSTSWSTFPFLIDSVSVGYTWTRSYLVYSEPMAVTLVDSMQIIKMNDTLLSNGTVYTDVIGVKFIQYVNGYILHELNVKYYAKNIGLVRKEIIYHPAPGEAEGTWVLDNYFINH